MAMVEAQKLPARRVLVAAGARLAHYVISYVTGDARGVRGAAGLCRTRQPAARSQRAAVHHGGCPLSPARARARGPLVPGTAPAPRPRPGYDRGDRAGDRPDPLCGEPTSR